MSIKYQVSSIKIGQKTIYSFCKVIGHVIKPGVHQAHSLLRSALRPMPNAHRPMPKTLRPLLFALLLFLSGTCVYANVALPAIFSDHMVLKQNTTVKMWGWANPTEKVKIISSWSSDTIETVGSNMAKWEVDIQTPDAGGPYSITVQGYNTLKIEDVLVGEVWLASGQSNMEWTTSSGIVDGEKQKEQANYPDIRLFTVYKRSSEFPSYDLDGEWVVCTPETMQWFSAVGYFFGRKIYDNLQVPVGLICSAWGGTPIEAWINKEQIDEDEELKTSAASLKEVPWGPVKSGVIYNAMSHPLMPFGLSGILWYQGEANTENASTYSRMLSTLIHSWRDEFKQDLPFFFAQIAPYNDYWADSGVQVREQQRRTLSVPNTGMIVLSDIGDTTNIHPKRKVEVGERFADLALNRVYGKKEFPESGPLFNHIDISGNKVTVKFDYNKGLFVKGKSLTYFEMAGADGKWYPAKAKIKSGDVILSCSKVKVPVDVRFAWSNSAVPNLFNGDDLPASCYTTK